MHADAGEPVSTKASNREAAWSGYWALGSAHSCVGSYGDRYGGAIGRFWTRLFSGLQSGARVLDLATGNGALARLLVDARPQADFGCDAVDSADVAPTWVAALPQTQRDCLRFHARTDIAALPFAAHSFDLAVSQYGFEYAPAQSAIRELARVLKPGSPLALVLHHADSHVARLAATESEHLRWLLHDSELFDAGMAMVEPMSRAATAEGRASLAGDPSAEALRLRFNEALARVASKAASSPAPDALFTARDALMAMLAQSGLQGAQACAAAMQRLRAEHSLALERLEDMLEHTLDQDRALALRAQLQTRLQQSVVLAEMHEGEHLMAWVLQSATIGGTLA